MVDPLKATKVCDKRKYMEMMERATSQSDEKRRTFALGSEIVTAHAYLGSQVPPPTKKEITHHEIHRSRSRRWVIIKKLLTKLTLTWSTI